MTDLTPLKQAVIDGNMKKVLEIVEEALKEKIDPQLLLTDHMIPGMLEVGELMAEGEYFIPEVLRSAKAMNRALELVEPLLVGADRETAGDVIIGSVKRGYSRYRKKSGRNASEGKWIHRSGFGGGCTAGKIHGSGAGH